MFGAPVVWARIVPSSSRTRMTAWFGAANRLRSGRTATIVRVEASIDSAIRSRSSSTPAASSLLKSERMRATVSCPTRIPKPERIRQVSAAEVSASRQRMGMRSSTEHVAGAADRVQQARLAAGLELTPQVGHEHLDRVRGRERVVAPDLLEQPLAGPDDALVAHEVLEQLELALGELDLALGPLDLVRVRVQRQVADDERRAAPRRPAAQERAQAGEQLLALERLDEVVVGARVEAL